MIPRNIHNEKKWIKNSNKKFNYFFYTGGIKADASRKLRRLCNMYNISYMLLPSAFAIKTLYYAQGPSIGIVYAENICFASYKALNQKAATAIFEKDRAYPSSFLKDLDKLENPQSMCANFCDLIETNSQKLCNAQ